MEILASSGLIDASLLSIGPALPSTFNPPPPGSFAVRENGTDEVAETSKACRSSASYTCFFGEVVELTVTRPSLRSSFAMEKAVVAEELVGLAVAFESAVVSDE